MNVMVNRAVHMLIRAQREFSSLLFCRFGFCQPWALSNTEHDGKLLLERVREGQATSEESVRVCVCGGSESVVY